MLRIWNKAVVISVNMRDGSKLQNSLFLGGRYPDLNASHASRIQVWNCSASQDNETKILAVSIVQYVLKFETNLSNTSVEP